MAFLRRSEPTATETLRATVAELPSDPRDWTAEQRSTHHEQSNQAMREQANQSSNQS
ncbi:hypothetical protein [Streptomyces fractus]|uniref:hypothetical protein n=1 Tax=Streptomyces fractus TaxID=641806 RepID=UPI003CF9E6B1